MADEQPTFSSEKTAVPKTLKEAFANKSNADKLLADPSAFFRRNGLDIPQGHEKEFNDYFHDVAGGLATRLRETPESQLSSAHDELLQSQALGINFRCISCKIAVYAVAVAIVAVGAVALGSLTVESGPVLALAGFAGVSARVALAFIRGLGAAVRSGVKAVAERICGWTHAC